MWCVFLVFVFSAALASADNPKNLAVENKTAGEPNNGSNATGRDELRNAKRAMESEFLVQKNGTVKLRNGAEALLPPELVELREKSGDPALQNVLLWASRVDWTRNRSNSANANRGLLNLGNLGFLTARFNPEKRRNEKSETRKTSRNNNATRSIDAKSMTDTSNFTENSEVKPGSGSRSDSKTAKSDPNTTRSDSKASRSDSKESRADSKASKSDSKSSRSDSKASRSDSKSSRSDSKASRSDSKASRSDSKATRSDSKASRSDSKASRSDKKGSRSDSKDGNLGSTSAVVESSTESAKKNRKRRSLGQPRATLQSRDPKDECGNFCNPP